MKKCTMFFVLLFSSSFSVAKKSNTKLIKQQKQKFVLITVLDNETNVQRMAEYIKCLERNLIHPSIEQVHVLYDVSKDDGVNRLWHYIISQQIPITYIEGKPTYGYCFRLANRLYPNRKIILSNSDMYFNRTLKLLEPYNIRNIFLVLTRWNATRRGKLYPFYLVRNGRYAPNAWSQDVWLFHTPLRKFKHDKIRLGSVHAAGRIAYHAKECGLRVFNPCMSIQSCRLQVSHPNRREYNMPVHQNYPKMLVSWSRLGKRS